MEVLRIGLAIAIILIGALYMLLWRHERRRREKAEYILDAILKKQGVSNVALYRLPKTGELVVLLDGKEL